MHLAFSSLYWPVFYKVYLSFIHSHSHPLGVAPHILVWEISSLRDYLWFFPPRNFCYYFAARENYNRAFNHWMPESFQKPECLNFWWKQFMTLGLSTVLPSQGSETGATRIGPDDWSRGSVPLLASWIWALNGLVCQHYPPENEPAPISWCMRTQRKAHLSGEPLFWGGYLEPVLSHSNHCGLRLLSGAFSLSDSKCLLISVSLLDFSMISACECCSFGLWIHIAWFLMRFGR